MEALRYSAADIAAVTELVALHLRFHTYKMGWSDSAVRRYVRDAGDAARRAQRAHALRLHRPATSARPPSCRRRIDELEVRIDELAAAEELAALRPELDGTDVMAILGVTPGPVVGQALAHLLEIRLDDGLIGRDAATQRLLDWYATR